MSRQDKVGAALLGLLLFSGLFYFIYTTMKNPLPPEFGEEEFVDEALEDEDFTEEQEPEAEAPPAAPAAETTETPAR
jgi:hypothetical protein